MRLFLILMLFISASAPFCHGGAVESISLAAKETGKVAIFMKQSKSIDLLNEKIEGELLICTDKNGRIRYQTFSPYESIMIFDGRELSQYMKFPDGWKKMSAKSLDTARKITSEFSKLIVGDYSSFEVSEIGGKIILVPKDGIMKKFIKSVSLIPSDDAKTVKSIEFTYSNGDKTLLSVVKIVLNPKNFDSAFSEVFNFKVDEK